LDVSRAPWWRRLRRRTLWDARAAQLQTLGSSLTPFVFPEYSQVLPAISNRNPKEQALIGRWWHDVHGSFGRLIRERYL
jgi:hypothetical protein